MIGGVVFFVISLISGNCPFFASFSSRRLSDLSNCTLTKPVPACNRLSSLADWYDKSIILSLTNGPLSLILTINDLLFFKLVTFTAEGIGSVLWAAVNLYWLKIYKFL